MVVVSSLILTYPRVLQLFILGWSKSKQYAH